MAPRRRTTRMARTPRAPTARRPAPPDRRGRPGPPSRPALPPSRPPAGTHDPGSGPIALTPPRTSRRRRAGGPGHWTERTYGRHPAVVALAERAGRRLDPRRRCCLVGPPRRLRARHDGRLLPDRAERVCDRHALLPLVQLRPALADPHRPRSLDGCLDR